MLQRSLHRLAQAVLPVAHALGAPGVGLIALLDSSFLTFPEVTDALIVMLTVDRPQAWWLYGVVATLGSWWGCLALYYVARRGGEAVLDRWIRPETKARLFSLFARFGLVTIVVGSLAPPPVPFKPFVVLAGATRVSPLVFSLFVIGARGFRYVGEAWLARRYGSQAVRYMNQNIGHVAFWAGIVLLAAGGAFLVWKRLRAGYNTSPAL